jgi:hypothetical protein
VSLLRGSVLRQFICVYLRSSAFATLRRRLVCGSPLLRVLSATPASLRETLRAGLCGEFQSDPSNVEHHDVPVSRLIDQVLDGLRTEQFAELFSGRVHQWPQRTKGGLSAGTSLGIFIESAG